MTSRPVAWVVCARLGEHSQPWIWRQVTSFQHVRPEVVAGGYDNARTFPLDGVPLHIMPAVGARPAGRARWLRRASGLVRRNFVRLEPAHTRALVSLARQRQPQVAPCHFGHVALRILPAARAAGIPVVAHFHGLDLSASLRNRWYRWSLQASLGQLAAAVVVGRHQLEWLTARGLPRDRVHLIPCGVPVDAYRVRRHREVQRPRFIAVSRLVAWKGVDVSLRAFAHVARPPARSDVRRRRRRSGARGSGATLRRPRRPAGGDVPRRPSSHSGHAGARLCRRLPPALGQSRQRLGRGVRHRGHRGLRERPAGRRQSLRRHPRPGGRRVTGFLVDQHDTTTMAERMLTLALDDGLRQHMGAAGRKMAQERFDLPRQVGRLESVLLEVSGHRPPRRGQPPLSAAR